ncbi:hypothetical protein MPSEU_000573600 [Mayamaea pseudoterrestris]|nr:hypothetical protein MPSEU_000573600 [Mayamaea pseudoterrestris]
MASSFRRRRPESSNASSQDVKVNLRGLQGTKAWTGGITLTSSGLRDLDVILGGGLPLGTCVYLQEDGWTNSLTNALLTYWCAEALSQEHFLLIPVADQDENFELLTKPLSRSRCARNDLSNKNEVFLPTQAEIGALLYALPKNLNWDKQEKRTQQQQHEMSSETFVLNSLQEGEEDESDDDKDAIIEEAAEAGLQIAWQYRKSVQQQRLGLSALNHIPSQVQSVNVYCHSYDLSGKMSSQRNWKELNVMLKPFHTQPCGFRFFKQLWTTISSIYSTSTPTRVMRVLLYHTDRLLISIALPLVLAKIRQEELPVVVMVVEASAKASDTRAAKILRRSVDVVLETEHFATRASYPPPPEFREFSGILKIRKVTTATAATANGGGHYCDMTTTKRPAALVYGLKRDRRKLHVQLLHIPPEEYAQGGSSVGGTGVRSGAGRKDEVSCASSGGGSSPLDF